MVLPDDPCADLAFINGKIVTLDKGDTICEAVSVKDGRILKVGNIKVDKMADLVVGDRDPLIIDPSDLKNIKTLMTVIDGKIVYEKH